MTPAGPLTPEAYLRDRVMDQEQWYRTRAAQHERTRIFWVVLIVSANFIAATLAFFALEMWVSVVTTLVGVLTTYSALSAADFLASSYGSTARQLANLSEAWRTGRFGTDDAAFRRFVQHVEQVISREHSGWSAVVGHVSEQDL